MYVYGALTLERSPAIVSPPDVHGISMASAKRRVSRRYRPVSDDARRL